MPTKRKYVPIGYEGKEERDEGHQVSEEISVIVPEKGDNCAIASTFIAKGTAVRVAAEGSAGGSVVTVDYDILEGHRFALCELKPGDRLTSWGLMFGVCCREIFPGNYICNERMLVSLSQRGISDLPPTPNFVDKIEPYVIDEKTFVPSPQIPLLGVNDTFMGFARSGNRGVGTRNFVIVLGTTSHTSSYAREVCKRVNHLLPNFKNVDGIVPVAHTECGGADKPNNYELLLRVLAGFLVHSNVGAALVVDYGSESLKSSDLIEYMSSRSGEYNLANTATKFLTLRSDFERDLDAGASVLTEVLLPMANATSRTPQPVSYLNVALQCGGSDAFSGVSGNPTAGRAAKELIQRGGKAVLAETDELIGAESYVLDKCKDLQVAKKFIDFIERFKYRMACHGQSAEANPSGGNNFRGLYNISLKSLGAAKKKNADVSLDAVVDYGENITARERGYYFMDSPGNDLESIAGQVATGCNFIYFITGNGSITNFPFVPTIKILTTTRRFELLRKEMDFNAGRYQEGTSLDELGAELYRLTVESASGALTVGEKAKHSQISIWRNWNQSTLDQAAIDRASSKPLEGLPLPLKRAFMVPASTHYLGYECRKESFGPERVALLMPTSLCSSQIANLIADEMNRRMKQLQAEKKAAKAKGGGEEEAEGDDDEGDEKQSEEDESKIDRFVALPHTEGCGTGYAQSEGDDIYTRTVLGHLAHPNVRLGLLLEHGCEKHHNDFIANALRARGVDPEQYGWASVQLDGGIEKVTQKVAHWFDHATAKIPSDSRQRVPFSTLTVALMSFESQLDPIAAHVFSGLVQTLVQAGASVVIPQHCSLLASAEFLDDLMEAHAVTPSLAFGQPLVKKAGGAKGGCYVMATPSTHWVEILGGLCSAGVQIAVGLASRTMQGHPMLPVLQISSAVETIDSHLGPPLSADFDGRITQDEVQKQVKRIYAMMIDTLNNKNNRFLRKVTTNVDFQISRGELGCST